MLQSASLIPELLFLRINQGELPQLGRKTSPGFGLSGRLNFTVSCDTKYYT